MINKIMCFCGSGLGTSFVMEMNVKKALANLGVSGVEVVHSTIDDVMPGAADLFVCSADLVSNAEKAGKAIGIQNMVSVKEMEEKLKAAFVKPPVFNFRYISCNLSLYHLHNSSVFSIIGEKSCKTDVHLKRTYFQYPYKRVLRPSAF